jgi:hypothetical protein
MPGPEDFEPDGQDLAEVFDEENITNDGRDIATSDMQRDVFDVTSVEEDANEALEPEDDFDPDEADEAELEEILMVDEDLDRPRHSPRDRTDLVSDQDLTPADMESEDLFSELMEELDEADDDAAIRPGH